jgi:putative transposase
MSNYRRSSTKGGIFFFTVVTHNRLPIFNNAVNIRAFRTISNDVRNELPFKEIACVILHDHIHSIWKLPEDDHNFSKRWGIIKARFTKYLRSNGCDVSGYPVQVWQKRFWEHKIRDINDLNNHIDYIHYNPVKHGYVNNVIDWPYSSFKRFVDNGYYDIDWGSDVIFKNEDQYGE